jgi:hydroxymethylglutaryl-CoA reductase
MRLLSECGGVKTTVVDDQMQRAPAFIFNDALQAREFGEWIDAHCDDIRAAAEATTRSGKLTYIGHYQVGPLRYLRINYTTGDAAGQNLTGKATPSPPASGSGTTIRVAPNTCCQARSTPTRSTPRSTCCSRAASA